MVDRVWQVLRLLQGDLILGNVLYALSMNNSVIVSGRLVLSSRSCCNEKHLRKSSFGKMLVRVRKKLTCCRHSSEMPVICLVMGFYSYEYFLR